MVRVLLYSMKISNQEISVVIFLAMTTKKNQDSVQQCFLLLCYWSLFLFISNFDIFSWSHQVILSVSRNRLIQKVIGQCDVKHIMMLQIKTITSVLKIARYVITGITAHQIRLNVILVIMSVSTFKTDITLYFL